METTSALADEADLSFKSIELLLTNLLATNLLCLHIFSTFLLKVEKFSSSHEPKALLIIVVSNELILVLF
jgi:uncharacterized membrane protein